MRPVAPQPVFTEAVADDSVPTRSSLLSRLRDAGDDASWRTFFETYWRLLYNVARKSGLSDEDAQDVVQETVIAVARKMPEFRYDPQTGSFKQWLLLITRRRIHDHFRRTYRSPPGEHGSGSQPSRAAEAAPTPTLPPDAQMDAIPRRWPAMRRGDAVQPPLVLNGTSGRPSRVGR